MRLSIKLIIYFLVLFVWTWVAVAPALAQPELKVGQDAEFFWESGGEACIGRVVRIEDNFFVLKRYDRETDVGGFLDTPTRDYIPCWAQANISPWEIQISKALMSGYRILKPAPRPEFKLPSEINIGCGYERGESFMWMKGTNIPFRCFAPNDEAIADELRYLRKKVEALRK